MKLTTPRGEFPSWLNVYWHKTCVTADSSGRQRRFTGRKCHRMKNKKSPKQLSWQPSSLTLRHSVGIFTLNRVKRWGGVLLRRCGRLSQRFNSLILKQNQYSRFDWSVCATAFTSLNLFNVLIYFGVLNPQRLSVALGDCLSSSSCRQRQQFLDDSHWLFSACLCRNVLTLLFFCTYVTWRSDTVEGGTAL